MSEPTKFRQDVMVSDIDIPFRSMVGFLVKLALAAIPAMIILTLIGAMLFGVLAAMFSGSHPGH